MILVDTSVWIDYLRGVSTADTQSLDAILTDAMPFAITGVIYQEILQGADSPSSFHRLAEHFGSQRFLHPADPVVTYAKAGEIYGRCRREGITIRSTIDCLIARIAIEHDAILLHSGRDYERMATVIPELRLA